MDAHLTASLSRYIASPKSKSVLDMNSCQSVNQHTGKADKTTHSSRTHNRNTCGRRALIRFNPISLLSCYFMHTLWLWFDSKEWTWINFPRQLTVCQLSYYLFSSVMFSQLLLFLSCKQLWNRMLCLSTGWWRRVFLLQVIKMLVIVVALFAICWLPLQSYNVLQDIYPEINGFVDF